VRRDCEPGLMLPLLFLLCVAAVIAVGSTCVLLVKCSSCSGEGIVRVTIKGKQIDSGWVCGTCKGRQRITLLTKWRTDKELPVGPYRRPVWTCSRHPITAVQVEAVESDEGESECRD
jgi:hypothetical protein